MAAQHESALAWGATTPRRSVLAHYKDADLRTRSFLTARWAMTPYTEMAARFPKQGDVLDLACGHGLLSLALALGSPARRVTGIDHDEPRVAIAQRAARGVPNLDFRAGDFRALDEPRTWDAIGIIDTMHYFPYPLQESTFAKVFARVRPGGTFIFREVDPTSAGVASLINRLHEKFMVGLHITKAEELHFRNIAGWAELARNAGFEVTSQPFARFPYADVLFTCTRP